MKTKIVPASMLAFGMTFSAVACGDLSTPTGTTQEGGQTEVEASKVKLTAKKLPGRDPLGDYRYKVKLTNRTGEGLDVDAFNFRGVDSDGNRYDAIPTGDLDSVRLADGKSTSGTITFSSNDIVKIIYEELFGKDGVSAKVKR